MFQGSDNSDERNRIPFPFSPREINAVLLTHAHIDHSGLLPRLVREGFEGKICATPATADLCTVMLPDSAHIQEMESQWQNRKNIRKGEKPLEPLYTRADADRTLTFFEPVPYNTPFPVANGVEVCLRDAGHILGSAIVEVSFQGREGKKKIVFSGDLGNQGQPIVRDPDTIEDAHFVFLESTYGDRLHRTMEDTLEEFVKILDEAVRKGGKVIIPAFAVERTQEVLYSLHMLEKQGKIPMIPTYVDSPLAISATEIFRRHPECFDEEAHEILAQGESPFSVKSLTFTRTTEESQALNELEGPAVIISASGMCEAGRIKHHLKHNVWKPETQIVIIGFQAQGTTGRKLVEGARRIKIFHEDVMVRAKVHTLGGFSAHADQKGLMEWLGKVKNPDLRVYVVHGEEEISLEFASRLEREFPFPIYVPFLGETISLLEEPVVRELKPMAAKEAVLSESTAKMVSRLQGLMDRLSSQRWQEEPFLRQRVERQVGKLDKVIEKLEKMLGGTPHE
jgi:metallo-beta-lactamase family protein